MGPRKNKNKTLDVKDFVKDVPAVPAASSNSNGNVNLPTDLAALLNQKILEFEKSSQEEGKKSQKEQQVRARVAAKTKTKEVKALVANSDIAESEKVRLLLEQLSKEDLEANSLSEEAATRITEISDLEDKVDASQVELNKALYAKNKLESLFRQLQTQTNNLIDERRRLTEAERQKRQDLADEFQHTIADVKKKMDQQASERSRLALENEVLRNQFKDFFEKYDRREKELVEQQKDRDVEVEEFEANLTMKAKLYKEEALRERQAQLENDDLSQAEQQLRSQLSTYGNKFQHFQDALSKSDKVLGQYKRQKGKMQQRIVALEKENTELRGRNEKGIAKVTKDRDNVLKEKEQLQERCKKLQAERQSLLEQVQDAS
eukprot:TRINITY_DN94012_c0_g1_i1.p1 TRINITY_DN94012_c0_g1~~TRINITY_DN94012_c0_g1_i1.p1  ORF type:complete len:376 (-),score=93.22 TRINITY_DN94012_c0_g1_i1:186-1313(-)